MDLGIGGGRNLGTMTIRPELIVDVGNRYGEDIAELVQDPDSSNRVLSIARSITQLGVDLGDVIGESDDSKE